MECVLSPYVSYPFDHIQSFPALIPELGELLSGNDNWNNDIFVSGYEDDLILRSPTKKRKRYHFEEELSYKRQKTSVATVLETPPRSVDECDSLSVDEVMSPGPMYSSDYMSQDSQDYIEQSDTSEAEAELSLPPKRTLKRRATRRTQSLDLIQPLEDDEEAIEEKKRPSQKKRSSLSSSSVSPNKNRGGARRRSHFLKATTDRLKQWLLDHIDHPYPSEEEKISLSSETGLTIKQINYWFTNSRRRFLKKWREEHQMK